MDVAHLPSSLVHAVRDLLAILAVGLVSGALLAVWCLHVEAGWWAAVRVDLRPGTADAVRLSVVWLRMVAPFLPALWCAGRGRAGTATRWRPAWTAIGVVAAGTVLAILPSGLRLVDTWPGPDLPLAPGRDGSWELALSPAWAFPVLTAALLAAAALLGVRDGVGSTSSGSSGDRASTGVPAPTRTSALGAAVIGIPSVALTAAAVAAILGVSAKFSSTSSVDWFFAGGPIWCLALALGAAVLVSGTGPSGVVAAGAAALPAVVMPVRSWLAGGDDLLLVQAAASVLVCAVVTGWRPCFVWAAGALAGAEPPPPAEPALPAPTGGDPRA